MKSVFLYDVTFRDGAQGPDMKYDVEKALKALHLFDEMGFDFLELGCIGSNPCADEFIRRGLAMQSDMKQLIFTVFGKTPKHNERIEDSDIAKIVKSGARAATIVCKSRLMDVYGTLRMDPQANLASIWDTVRFAKQHGVIPILDLEHAVDAWRGRGKMGKLLRSEVAVKHRLYFLAVVETAIKAGADHLVICDTNGGAKPEEVAEMVKALREQFPETIFGIHCHRDRNRAEVNTQRAVESGVRHVQGTILGYGERCGNADLCTIIPVLALENKINFITPEAQTYLTRLANVVAGIFGEQVPVQQPFVGHYCFGSGAGFHLASVLKDSKSDSGDDEGVYSHTDPALFGNKARVMINDNSGKSNLLLLAKQLGLPLDKDQASEILRLYPKMVEYGAFSVCREAFVLAFLEVSGQMPDFFTVVEHFYSGATGGNSARVVVVKQGGKRRVGKAKSIKGPYDVLSKAFFAATEKDFPIIAETKIQGFFPKIFSASEDGSGAMTRVLIPFGNNGNTWKGVGVDSDLTVAGFKALVMGARWALYKQYAQNSVLK